MKVILLRDQLHLGRRGQVVEVKPGHARNYLLPQGLAMEATPGNLKVFEQRRVKIDARAAKEQEAAAAVAAQLAGVQVTIAKKVAETQTLYGSVTATEVAEALQAKGFTVDRRRIDLGGGIKTVGDHVVRIELHHDVVADVAVTVVAEE